MKKQNGFISSSSSTSISYSTHASSISRVTGYVEGYEKLFSQSTKNWTGSTWDVYSDLKNTTYDQNVTWTTYKSSSYQRIEYFMEAVEKLNTAYSKNNKTALPAYLYSKNVANRNLYDGFVDIVITIPCRIRLAGIELINPWNNKLSNDKEYNYWRYLPKVFSIFKVNDEYVNAANEFKCYENDVAKLTYSDGKRYLRPVWYSNIQTDDNLTFLGSYDVNWENISNYKCFFKFNENDKISIASEGSETKLGTATWECKQLVIRIFKGYDQDVDYQYSADYDSGIRKNICKYILDRELDYGTTVYGEPITLSDIESFYEIYLSPENENLNISNALNDESNNPFKQLGIKFGGSVIRRYDTVGDVKFTTGIEYKLGGIQLLLSPDIFSVSEMKMYNYSNTTNNKVFIGEWNKNDNALVYYGAGTTKRSSLIDLADLNAPSIIWKHNFNIPPKYLDVKVYAQFVVDYGSFYAGDVVTNLVNINREPLTLRLTGTDVMLNISNGVCFTNPESGEFMIFKDGMGIQMDRPGNDDAYNAAVAIGANIVTHQSIVSTKIDGCPFKIYFVVKRLF